MSTFPFSFSGCLVCPSLPFAFIVIVFVAVSYSLVVSHLAFLFPIYMSYESPQFQPWDLMSLIISLSFIDWYVCCWCSGRHVGCCPCCCCGCLLMSFVPCWLLVTLRLHVTVVISYTSMLMFLFAGGLPLCAWVVLSSSSKGFVMVTLVLAIVVVMLLLTIWRRQRRKNPLTSAWFLLFQFTFSFTLSVIWKFLSDHLVYIFSVGLSLALKLKVKIQKFIAVPIHCLSFTICEQLYDTFQRHFPKWQTTSEIQLTSLVRDWGLEGSCPCLQACKRLGKCFGIACLHWNCLWNGQQKK